MQSFESSTFKLAYDRGSASRSLEELATALWSFLRQFTGLRGITASCADDLTDRLINEAWPRVADGSVATAAQLLWTSGLAIRSPDLQRELYWMLNEAVRDDGTPLINSVVPLVRAINLLCVRRGSNSPLFPPGGRLYRGTSMPAAAIEAYRLKETRKLRVRGFLATSFQQQVCIPYTYITPILSFRCAQRRLNLPVWSSVNSEC